jgi:hypothetical protein
MSQLQRKTINVMPPKGKMVVAFIDDMRRATEEAITQLHYSEYLDSSEIILSWYNDFPVSDMAAVTIEYSSPQGEDLVNHLIQMYKQNGFDVIGISLY